MRRIDVPDAVLCQAQMLLDQYNGPDAATMTIDTNGAGVWKIKLATHHVVDSLWQARSLIERWPHGTPLSLTITPYGGTGQAPKAQQFEVIVCSNHLVAVSSAVGMTRQSNGRALTLN